MLRFTSAAGILSRTRFDNVSWNNAAWELSTTNLDQGHYQSRASIANGYHGINVAALGPFFEVDTPVDGDNINGWPLFDRRQTFATVGGFWNLQAETNGSNFPWLWKYGGVSIISGIPHWGGIVVDLGGDTYLDASTDPSEISNFTTVLDMKRGLMLWAFTWTPNNTNSFDISYQMFAHKLHVNQGIVSMNISSQKATNATVVNVLNGDSALRTTFVAKGEENNLVYTAVKPQGVSNVTAYIWAGLSVSGARIQGDMAIDVDRPYAGNNESSIAQSAKVIFQPGEVVSFTKYVGIASTDGFGNPSRTAQNACIAAMKSGFLESWISHAQEWETIFPNDSADDFAYVGNGSLPNDPYIVESAIMAVVNPYMLLQNTIGVNAINAANHPAINSHSIAVGGLTSDSYAGQIYWDAEVWMQPGLVAAHPFAAKGIANYRVATYSDALANIKTAYQSSKKGANFSTGAAIFPWTGGRYANCTAVGPCFDYEYHINGDIAQELVNYWLASGDSEYFQTELLPIYDSLAAMYSNILTKNGSRYELTNMTDPDEYANNVDNGGYTMPLIADTLTNANQFRSFFNQTPNATWTSQSQDILISRNEAANIILEYTSMNGSIGVKQADVVLDTYPLRYKGQDYNLTSSLSDLDYYASKQSQDGPGMTYAIFSIVANEVSPSGCAAYTYQQFSEYPYVRPPFFQFSEQLVDDYAENGGTHPAYPFLTGHGGANQVVLFGYLGLRYVPDGHLHVDPALPPQIPQIRYRTFYYQGLAITAFSNQTHTTLSRVESSPSATGGVFNATLANDSIPVIVGSDPTAANYATYSLPVNGSLILANRMNAFNATVPGNAAQCQPVTSSDAFVPGQFPISAVDGSVSTKWQPMQANVSASITVSLKAGEKVVSFNFDWAQAPPVNISVFFSNSSTAQGSAVLSKNISVETPYVASQAALIQHYKSNQTTFTLNNVFSAKYATLSIIGNQGLGKGQYFNGSGATVAEWAIVTDSSSAQKRHAAVAQLPRGPSKLLDRMERYVRTRRRMTEEDIEMV